MFATAVRFLVILSHLVLQASRYGLGLVGYTLATPLLGRDEGLARKQRLKARCLAALFRNLQATFIKIGQVLSTRRDLLPGYVIEELETLQDRVPELSFRRIRQVIEQDLGQPVERLFGRLSRRPVAAGSIAQVHEGLLPSGERVAVKVQRPGIDRVIERDLRIIGFFARCLHRISTLSSLDLPSLARELGRAIAAQLDFPAEVRSCKRFARNFADITHVRLPRIYDDLCGERVITMSFVEGHKLTRLPAGESFDRPLLAKRLIGIYHQMVFKHFFLHADLHPGNILVGDDGVIHLIDTGLVYEIPTHYVRKFVRVGMALLTMNARLLAEAYLEGCDVSPQQMEQAARELEAVLGRYRSRGFSDFEVGEVLVEILSLLRRNGVVLDAEWTGMILSDLTFEGIAKSLDKEIDLMQLTRSSLPGFLASYDFISSDDPLAAALMASMSTVTTAAAA